VRNKSKLEGVMKNTIIYILGHSGSGKYTIGREISSLYDFKLVDNHYINNVIFQLIETDGRSQLPEKVWEYTRAVRKAVFGTIRDLSNPNSNFIFTNALMKEQAISEPIFNDILDIVGYRKSNFFTVILDISKEELKKRISNVDRQERLKDSSPENAEKAYDSLNVYEPKDQKAIHVDVTNKTARQAAEEIMEKVSLAPASRGVLSRSEFAISEET